MGVGDNESLKVYVRLPTKITEELQIKDLHPDIRIVQLPRQKSTRWCFIVFQDEEVLDRVVAFLKQLKIDGKRIVVKPFKRRQPRKKVKASLVAAEAVQPRSKLPKDSPKL